MALDTNFVVPENPGDRPAQDASDAVALIQSSRRVPVRDVTQAIAKARSNADSAFVGRVPDYDALLKAYDTVEALENGVLKKSGLYDTMQSAARSLIKFGREDEASLILNNSVDGMNALLKKNGLDIKDLRSNRTKAGIMAGTGITDEALAQDLEDYRRMEMSPDNPKYHSMTVFNEALNRNMDDKGQPLPQHTVLGNANRVLATYDAAHTQMGSASPAHAAQVASIAAEGNLGAAEVKTLVDTFIPVKKTQDTGAMGGDGKSLGIDDIARYDEAVGHMRGVVATAGKDGVNALKVIHDRGMPTGLDTRTLAQSAVNLAEPLKIAADIPRFLGAAGGDAKAMSDRITDVVLLNNGVLLPGSAGFDTATTNKTAMLAGMQAFATASSSGNAAPLFDWLVTHGNSIGVTDEALATKLGITPEQLVLYKSGQEKVTAATATPLMQAVNNFQGLDLMQTSADEVRDPATKAALLTYQSNGTPDADGTEGVTQGTLRDNLSVADPTLRDIQAARVERVLAEQGADVRYSFGTGAVTSTRVGSDGLQPGLTGLARGYIEKGGVTTYGEFDKAYNNATMIVGGVAGDRIEVPLSYFASNPTELARKLAVFETDKEANSYMLTEARRIMAAPGTSVALQPKLTGAVAKVTAGKPVASRQPLTLSVDGKQETLQPGDPEAETKLRYAIFREIQPNTSIKSYAEYKKKVGELGAAKEQAAQGKYDLGLSAEQIQRVMPLVYGAAGQMNTLARAINPADAKAMDVSRARVMEVKRQRNTAEIKIIEEELKVARASKDDYMVQAMSLLTKMVEDEDGEITYDGLMARAGDSAKLVNFLQKASSTGKTDSLTGLINRLNKLRQEAILIGQDES